MDSTPEPPQLDPAVLALSSAPTDVQLLDPSTSPIQSCSVANSSDALNSITTAAPTTTVLQAPRVAAQVPLESSAMDVGPPVHPGGSMEERDIDMDLRPLDSTLTSASVHPSSLSLPTPRLELSSDIGIPSSPVVSTPHIAPRPENCPRLFVGPDPPWALDPVTLLEPRIDDSKFAKQLPSDYILSNLEHNEGGPRYFLRDRHPETTARVCLIDRWDEERGCYLRFRDLAPGQMAQNVAVAGEGVYGGALLLGDASEQLINDLRMLRFIIQTTGGVENFLSEFFLTLKYGDVGEGFLYTCSVNFIDSLREDVPMEFFGRGGVMIFWVVESLAAECREKVDLLIVFIFERHPSLDPDISPFAFIVVNLLSLKGLNWHGKLWMVRARDFAGLIVSNKSANAGEAGQALKGTQSKTSTETGALNIVVMGSSEYEDIMGQLSRLWEVMCNRGAILVPNNAVYKNRGRDTQINARAKFDAARHFRARAGFQSTLLDDFALKSVFPPSNPDAAPHVAHPELLPLDQYIVSRSDFRPARPGSFAGRSIGTSLAISVRSNRAPLATADSVPNAYPKSPFLSRISTLFLTPEASTTSVTIEYATDGLDNTPVVGISKECRPHFDAAILTFLAELLDDVDAVDWKGRERIHHRDPLDDSRGLAPAPGYRLVYFNSLTLWSTLVLALKIHDIFVRKGKLDSYLRSRSWIASSDVFGDAYLMERIEIWAIQTKEVSVGQWTIQPFAPRISARPPLIVDNAFTYSPFIWSPRSATIEATFSSSTMLPPWLAWNDGILSGTIPESTWETSVETVIIAALVEGEDICLRKRQLFAFSSRSQNPAIRQAVAFADPVDSSVVPSVIASRRTTRTWPRAAARGVATVLVSDEAPGLYDSSSLEQVHVENSLDPYLVKYIAEVLSDPVAMDAAGESIAPGRGNHTAMRSFVVYRIVSRPFQSGFVEFLEAHGLPTATTRLEITKYLLATRYLSRLSPLSHLYTAAQVPYSVIEAKFVNNCWIVRKFPRNIAARRPRIDIDTESFTWSPAIYDPITKSTTFHPKFSFATPPSIAGLRLKWKEDELSGTLANLSDGDEFVLDVLATYRYEDADCTLRQEFLFIISRTTGVCSLTITSTPPIVPPPRLLTIAGTPSPGSTTLPSLSSYRTLGDVISQIVESHLAAHPEWIRLNRSQGANLSAGQKRVVAGMFEEIYQIHPKPSDARMKTIGSSLGLVAPAIPNWFADRATYDMRPPSWDPTPTLRRFDLLPPSLPMLSIGPPRSGIQDCRLTTEAAKGSATSSPVMRNLRRLRDWERTNERKILPKDLRQLSWTLGLAYSALVLALKPKKSEDPIDSSDNDSASSDSDEDFPDSNPKPKSSSRPSKSTSKSSPVPPKLSESTSANSKAPSAAKPIATKDASTSSGPSPSTRTPSSSNSTTPTAAFPIKSPISTSNAPVRTPSSLDDPSRSKKRSLDDDRLAPADPKRPKSYHPGPLPTQLPESVFLAAIHRDLDRGVEVDLSPLRIMENTTVNVAMHEIVDFTRGSTATPVQRAIAIESIIKNVGVLLPRPYEKQRKFFFNALDLLRHLDDDGDPTYRGLIWRSVARHYRDWTSRDAPVFLRFLFAAKSPPRNQVNPTTFVGLLLAMDEGVERVLGGEDGFSILVSILMLGRMPPASQEALLCSVLRHLRVVRPSFVPESMQRAWQDLSQLVSSPARSISLKTAAAEIIVWTLITDLPIAGSLNIAVLDRVNFSLKFLSDGYRNPSTNGQWDALVGAGLFNDRTSEFREGILQMMRSLEAGFGSHYVPAEDNTGSTQTHRLPRPLVAPQHASSLVGSQDPGSRVVPPPSRLPLAPRPPSLPTRPSWVPDPNELL